jgi:hypothetical protein
VGVVNVVMLAERTAHVALFPHKSLDRIKGGRPIPVGARSDISPAVFSPAIPIRDQDAETL